MLEQTREVTSVVRPEDLFAAIVAGDLDLGGSRWLTSPRRPWVALSVATRARSRSASLGVGDVVGSWQVAEVDSGRRWLRLRAAGDLPGDAWLEIDVAAAAGEGGSVLTQHVRVIPRGLSGRLHWFASQPVRTRELAARAQAIVRRAERG